LQLTTNRREDVTAGATVTRSATPKLAGYTGVAALAFFLGLALRLPELVAVGAPFAAIVAFALLVERPPDVDVGVTIDEDRAVEGEELGLTLDVRTQRPLELYVRLPPELERVEGDNPSAVARDEVIRIRVRAGRWGAFLPGVVHLRTHDPFRIVRYETTLDRRTPLKVFPRPETLRTLARPLETQVFAGNQVARVKGDGIEFADLRPFAHGDLVKRINWRASARRRELWVNEYHPERNADVILFIDAFAEARDASGSTLDGTVRAAAAIAAHYLREKDRVGLVSFGGVFNWLLPSTGVMQQYRIVDSLLDSRIVLSYAWKDVATIPPRTLPPQALVLALSPLLDERATDALLEVRARGFDLAVIEISPLQYVRPGRGHAAAIAHRLWRLRRDSIRMRYEKAGVPVSVWDDERTLGETLEEVRAFRRYARSGH
jgi:uncharacterized protein (DUF58 family)